MNQIKIIIILYYLKFFRNKFENLGEKDDLLKSINQYNDFVNNFGLIIIEEIEKRIKIFFIIKGVRIRRF